MRRFGFGCVLAALLIGGAAAGAEVSDVAGSWRTVRHGALVTMGDCGNGTPCGRLAWVNPAQKGGHTTDARNKNPALRARPLIGVPVLYGFVRAEGGWRNGKIYNPDDGKTFTAHMTLLSKDRLEVKGCLGSLCRKQIWTREK